MDLYPIIKRPFTYAKRFLQNKFNKQVDTDIKILFQQINALNTLVSSSPTGDVLMNNSGEFLMNDSLHFISKG